jgi:hypothetical protein
MFGFLEVLVDNLSVTLMEFDFSQVLVLLDFAFSLGHFQLIIIPGLSFNGNLPLYLVLKFVYFLLIFFDVFCLPCTLVYVLNIFQVPHLLK